MVRVCVGGGWGGGGLKTEAVKNKNAFSSVKMGFLLKKSMQIQQKYLTYCFFLIVFQFVFFLRDCETSFSP